MGPAGRGLTWVVDPIDGTRAFMTGMLHWGVLIALFDGVAPVLGVMYQPFTDELCIGTNAAADYRRGASSRSLADASVCDGRRCGLATTSRDAFENVDERAAFDALGERVRLVRYGGDCYQYCMLAMGHVDLVVEAGLKPYDVQALIPIVRARAAS